jgi:hypothetical protein
VVAQSVYCVTTEWMTGRSGHGQRIFILTSVSRPAVGPTQCPVQWEPRGPFSRPKARPGCDADRSPQSSAEIKNE